MESPVPAAYAYKLLLFFIPSSGAKQTIVSTTIRTHGVWAAFFTCLFVVFAWLFIFDAYFRRRFITNKHVKSKEMEYVVTGNEDTDPLINNNVTVNPSGDCNDIEMSSTMNSGSAKRHRSIVNHNKSFSAMLQDAAEGELRQALELSHENDLHSDVKFELHNNVSTNNTIPQSLAYDIHSSESSSIVTSTQMNTIASFLPPTHAAKNWVLTYSLRQHGASLSTLLAQNAKKTRSGQRMLVPCVILIEDSWGYVFGGFIAPLMQNKQGYYGNGESFVFSVVPTPRVHKWTGEFIKCVFCVSFSMWLFFVVLYNECAFAEIQSFRCTFKLHTIRLSSQARTSCLCSRTRIVSPWAEAERAMPYSSTMSWTQA